MKMNIFWQKLTDVLEMLTASTIKVMRILMMAAVSTAETSANFYQTTWRNIQENSFFRMIVCFWVYIARRDLLRTK
jgi:hypothetical protein